MPAAGTTDSSRASAELARALGARRTPDGGFCAVPGGPPDAESTAIAALALDDTVLVDGAVEWLLNRQRRDGAWPRIEAVPEPSWATAWAALALARRDGPRDALERAGRWLVEREGHRPGWLERWRARLSGADAKVEQDAMLRGWPWHADAIPWVEPTATALVALPALEVRIPVPGAAERIEEGRRLLWDRVCVGGGWNYGNRRVLGEVLPPFPDTTAFALLALQAPPADPRLDESFTALDRLLDERASGLALALGALATELHGRDASALRARVAQAAEGFDGPRETRSLAFMRLALSHGAAQLRVSSRIAGVSA